MDRYDIVFIGHMGTGTIVPFQGTPFVEQGGPVLFGPLAAACLRKRIAAVTTATESEDYLLEPLRSAGIDLFVQHGDIFQYRVVFPTANTDERQPFLVRRGTLFDADSLPPFEPCTIHLTDLRAEEFPLESMRILKDRGFRFSVDMQGLMFQPDEQTGAIRVEDVPEKKQILSSIDFAKFDVKEAKALTGTDVLQDQAEILTSWGNPEVIITCSEGALARGKGESFFAKFTNRSTRGRMGRGDTVIGAYLARRFDHSIEDSIRFAAALTSIKMESPGPFTGSLDDVLDRMRLLPG